MFLIIPISQFSTNTSLPAKPVEGEKISRYLRLFQGAFDYDGEGFLGLIFIATRMQPLWGFRLSFVTVITL